MHRMPRLPLAALLALVSVPAFGADLDAHQAQAREIYAKAISIPTEVGKGQVPVLANYLADRFRAAGFPDADIHVLPLGETASLVVRYAGNGTGGKPVLVM